MSISVEVLAGMLEVDERRFDRVLVMLFFFVEVADARAVVDAGGPLDRAGRGQQIVSTSVVFPADPWPQKTMLRMSSTLLAPC